MTDAASAPLVATDSESGHANAELVLGFFREVLGAAHDVAAVERYLDPGFVDHDPAGDDAGLDGVSAKLTGLWGAFPDGFYEPDTVVAAGDLVMVRSRLRARLAEADRAPVDVAFADTYRVTNGRITEHWHVVDSAALAAAFAG